jgi:hypothetical protein
MEIPVPTTAITITETDMELKVILQAEVAMFKALKRSSDGKENSSKKNVI